MSQIAELERRIAAALERIGKGVERLEKQPAAAPVDDGSELPRLRQELEAERAKTARLSERLNAQRERKASGAAQLERRLARMTEQLDLQSLEMLRLKKANAKLVEANAALRDAQIAGTPDSVVLNRSLSAELDALHAERRAEMAEMEEILAEIRPLVNGSDTHA